MSTKAGGRVPFRLSLSVTRGLRDVSVASGAFSRRFCRQASAARDGRPGGFPRDGALAARDRGAGRD